MLPKEKLGGFLGIAGLGPFCSSPQSVIFAIPKREIGLPKGEIWQLGKQRSGRAVYCTGLENRRPFTGSGGSNPSSSASINIKLDEKPANLMISGFLHFKAHQIIHPNSNFW